MIAFHSYPENDKLLAKHKTMLHEMYDAICVVSMFMIDGCNVCACKLTCCIADENKSLTAAGNCKNL